MMIQFTLDTFHQWTIPWFKFELLRLKMKTFSHHIKSKILKLHFFVYFKRRGIHATIVKGNNEYSFLHSFTYFSWRKCNLWQNYRIKCAQLSVQLQNNQKFNLVCIETLLEVYSNLVPSLAKKYKPFVTKLSSPFTPKWMQMRQVFFH